MIEGSTGNDIVYDFEDGTDRLDLDAFGIYTLAKLDAVASITQSGANTLIEFDVGGDTINIHNLNIGNQTDADFLL